MATLVGHSLPFKGHRRPDQIESRREILNSLPVQIGAGLNAESLVAKVDVLDAVHLRSAGLDFLQGSAVPPEDLDLAVKEGWNLGEGA